ncbi:DnaJ C-terminal domain-containing protein, partial [Nostoc sp. NIES-2111]
GAGRVRWQAAALGICQPWRKGGAARWLARPADVCVYLGATAGLGAGCRGVARAPGVGEGAIDRHAEGPLADVSFAAFPWPRLGDLTNCVRWLGPHAAALAGHVRLPTLRCAVAVNIPKNVSSGRTLRLRGKGFPAKDGAGDLLVTLEIVLPADAGEELRALLETWREKGVENPRKDF